eukprot:s1_g663.t1
MRKNKLILSSTLAGILLASAGVAIAAKGPGGGPPSPDRMFEMLDLNEDGEITREEAENARDARFEEADTNGDGLLSPEEMTAAREARAAERQQRRFAKLDTNEDGLLSPEELAASPRAQRREGMFDRVDQNGDGKITRAEAEAMHQKMQERFGDRKGRGVIPLKTENAAPVDAPNDDALMAALASGDAAAGRALVNAHLAHVLAVARRMLGDQAEAEDVAQDTFMRAWKAAERWEPGRAKVSTWLHRIAMNQCLDRLRKKKPEPLAPDFDAPSNELDPEAGVYRQELGRQIDAAIQALPERQRAAIAYGAEEARWPEADREAVRKLIAADPVLARQQAEEAELDALLDLAPVEAPSYALQGRILSVQKDEGVGGLGFVKQVLDVLWPYGSSAIPAGALAASIILGVASGAVTTITTDSWSDEQSYDVLALALGDTTLAEEWQ